MWLKISKEKKDRSCILNRIEPISLMNVFQDDILTKCMLATSKTYPFIFQTISPVLQHTLIVLKREKVGKMHQVLWNSNVMANEIEKIEKKMTSYAHLPFWKKRDKSCILNPMDPISLMNVFQADTLTKCMSATSKTYSFTFQTISPVLQHITSGTLIALKREEVGNTY